MSDVKTAFIFEAFDLVSENLFTLEIKALESLLLRKLPMKP